MAAGVVAMVMGMQLHIDADAASAVEKGSVFVAAPAPSERCQHPCRPHLLARDATAVAEAAAAVVAVKDRSVAVTVCTVGVAVAAIAVADRMVAVVAAAAAIVVVDRTAVVAAAVALIAGHTLLLSDQRIAAQRRLAMRATVPGAAAMVVVAVLSFLHAWPLLQRRRLRMPRRRQCRPRPCK